MVHAEPALAGSFFFGRPAMRLIDELKTRVELYKAYLVSEDRFNRSVQEGKAEPEAIARFLVNIHYLVKHTPLHLQLAAHKAKALPELKAYFQQKYLEEQGHDQWALDDLAKMSNRLKNPQKHPDVDRSMEDFVMHIEGLINKDPYLYLAYIFFAEYLVVIHGPELNHGITVTCGYGSEALTVVENHAELDQDHVHEWEGFISDIVDEQRYSKAFLSALDETILLHKKFFMACYGRVSYEAA